MTATLDTLRQRASILREIRRFFITNGFLEVETPILVRSPGMEPYLNAFKTVFTPEFSVAHGEQPLYLRTSPEFHMKRLLCKGCDRIFQLCRAFRNGETGELHEPEFTILEWYRTNVTYFAIMEDVENLFTSIIRTLFGDSFLSRNKRNIDYTPPWNRITVRNAWLQHTGFDPARSDSAETLRVKGLQIGVPHLKPDDSYETLYYKIFLDKIEPRLGVGKPVFLYEYPADMAALARLKPGEPAVALRFELYIDGMELANAFDELTDPALQRLRCMAARETQVSLGKEPFPIDEAFLGALETGMPPSAGIAMGVDRVVMLLLHRTRIQDVIAFPYNPVPE